MQRGRRRGAGGGGGEAGAAGGGTVDAALGATGRGRPKHHWLSRVGAQGAGYMCHTLLASGLAVAHQLGQRVALYDTGVTVTSYAGPRALLLRRLQRPRETGPELVVGQHEVAGAHWRDTHGAARAAQVKVIQRRRMPLAPDQAESRLCSAAAAAAAPGAVSEVTGDRASERDCDGAGGRPAGRGQRPRRWG